MIANPHILGAIALGDRIDKRIHSRCRRFNDRKRYLCSAILSGIVIDGLGTHLCDDVIPHFDPRNLGSSYIHFGTPANIFSAIEAAIAIGIWLWLRQKGIGRNPVSDFGVMTTIATDVVNIALVRFYDPFNPLSRFHMFVHWWPRYWPWFQEVPHWQGFVLGIGTTVLMTWLCAWDLRRNYKRRPQLVDEYAASA